MLLTLHYVSIVFLDFEVPTTQKRMPGTSHTVCRRCPEILLKYQKKAEVLSRFYCGKGTTLMYAVLTFVSFSPNESTTFIVTE
jgi:hypothetical protein